MLCWWAGLHITAIATAFGEPAGLVVCRIVTQLRDPRSVVNAIAAEPPDFVDREPDWSREPWWCNSDGTRRDTDDAHATIAAVRDWVLDTQRHFLDRRQGPTAWTGNDDAILAAHRVLVHPNAKGPALDVALRDVATLLDRPVTGVSKRWETGSPFRTIDWYTSATRTRPARMTVTAIIERSE